MQFVADIMMLAGSIGAAAYCFLLSMRLKKFTTLESGMGGAIAVLSAQVDDMTKALETARKVAAGSATSLDALTARAEATAARMEILLASLHDLPAPAPDATRPTQAATPDPGDPDRKLRFMRRRNLRVANGGDEE
jgi:hypothetical protein